MRVRRSSPPSRCIAHFSVLSCLTLLLLQGPRDHKPRPPQSGLFDWIPDFWVHSHPAMNTIAYHLVSGQAFFSGGVLLLIGCLLFFTRSKWLILLSFVLLVGGVLLVMLSATPLPEVLYIAWISMAAFWLLTESLGKHATRISRASRLLFALSCIGAMTHEARFRAMPRLGTGNEMALCILGDSLSAGIGFRGEITWSEVLRDRHGVKIVNLSRRGARTKSMRDRASRIPDEDVVILVEIGGNDILKRTPIDQFEKALDELLRRITAPSRKVAMIELPLLPFHNAFGSVQRRLAQKYDVKLVPKRFFARVLTGKNARVDAVHLSNAGHLAMASMVWNLLEN